MPSWTRRRRWHPSAAGLDRAARSAPDLVPGDAAMIVQHPLEARWHGDRERRGCQRERHTGPLPHQHRGRLLGLACFTGGWELAALHQGNGPAQPKRGDVLHNRGIPVSAILARLTDAGLAVELPMDPSSGEPVRTPRNRFGCSSRCGLPEPRRARGVHVERARTEPGLDQRAGTLNKRSRT